MKELLAGNDVGLPQALDVLHEIMGRQASVAIQELNIMPGIF
jgi:hypothetical protein